MYIIVFLPQPICKDNQWLHVNIFICPIHITWYIYIYTHRKRIIIIIFLIINILYLSYFTDFYCCVSLISLMYASNAFSHGILQLPGNLNQLFIACLKVLIRGKFIHRVVSIYCGKRLSWIILMMMMMMMMMIMMMMVILYISVCMYVCICRCKTS